MLVTEFTSSSSSDRKNTKKGSLSFLPIPSPFSNQSTRCRICLLSPPPLWHHFPSSATSMHAQLFCSHPKALQAAPHIFPFLETFLHWNSEVCQYPILVIRRSSSPFSVECLGFGFIAISWRDVVTVLTPFLFSQCSQAFPLEFVPLKL